MHAGIYRHYKGPLYLVLGLAHDANAEELHVYHGEMKDDQGGRGMWEVLGEREVVVYVPLELVGAHYGARMAVRTRQDFEAVVCGNPTCTRYGQVVPEHDAGWRQVRAEGCRAAHSARRFAYQGETLTEDMVLAR